MKQTDHEPVRTVGFANDDPFIGWFLRYISGLRMGVLFLITGALFLLDLLLLDPIPFLDELLLGVATVFLGTWRKRRETDPVDPVDPVNSGGAGKAGPGEAGS